MPKAGSQYICLSVILIDSVFGAGKNYYPQVFLKECKYVVKKFLLILMKKTLMKEILMKEI